MDWDIKEKNNVEIVECKGRLDVEASIDFKKNIKDIIADGKSRLVVNFNEVNFIDSTGLGALVACLRVANQQGGDVKLSNLKPEIRLVIELTRLHRVFEIFETEDEAISSFA